MEQNEILLLGLGLQAPWKLKGQHLNTTCSPHHLELEVGTDRGTRFNCPECGDACAAHDYQDRRWRHLNFFQHHCYISAKVPRVKCPEHGVRLVSVPWARSGSGFTLLFEQVVMSLVREMPVNAAARIIETTDKRLWRVINHYVTQALVTLDLSQLKAVGLDETAAKRGQRYVTVFIDMQRPERPVVFATPGRGQQTVADFGIFLSSHQGDPAQIREVVCDMSKAFLSGIAKTLPEAQVTVDWFHIVQHFCAAVDAVRKAERQQIHLVKGSRWAVLKRADSGKLTKAQKAALADLISRDTHTATAWLIKERLAWIRQARTPQAARWRITHFINYARSWVLAEPLLAPMVKALNTLSRHARQVIRRWTSTYTNARLEGLNGLFQAARARARGYRNEQTFITMIYLIASPIVQNLKST